MSGYGHSGPHADYRSYGPVVQAVSGLSYISGLPGREPSGWGLSYMDNQAAYYNSTALLMAIYRRKRTGQGTEIDVSAIEAGINLVGPVLLDVTVNGRITRRPDFPPGTGSNGRTPRPTASTRRAATTAGSPSPCSTRRSGRALVDAIGSPDVGATTRASPTQDGRFAHQDALDGHVAAWTARSRPLRAHRAAAATRRAGRRGAERRGPQRARPAGRAPRRVLRDGPSGDRPAPASRASPCGSPTRRPDNWRSAPLLGEDNEYVFKQIVGVSDDEYDELEAEGVI